jgi:hypothetical protein
MEPKTTEPYRPCKPLSSKERAQTLCSHEPQNYESLLGVTHHRPSETEDPSSLYPAYLMAHLLAFILRCPVYQFVLDDPLLRGQQPQELDPGV